jgi:small subunit ribosomal protein S9
VADVVIATGRRKEAVAKVRVFPGSGIVNVNGKPLGEYFPKTVEETTVIEPFLIANVSGKYDVKANVRGGGPHGQAGAVRLGVARALARLEPDSKGILGKNGMLTRDPRMKERKKYGQAAARKRFQFSKR